MDIIKIMLRNYYNLLWKTSLKISKFQKDVDLKLALDEKFVYLGMKGGGLLAINQRDGSIAWKFGINSSRFKNRTSLPLVYKDLVCFGLYDKNIYCVDRENGKEKKVFFDGDWVGGSLYLASTSGLMFAELEFGILKNKKGIIAFDIKTGEKKWRYLVEHGIHIFKYFEEINLIVLVNGASVVYGLSVESGETLWKNNLTGCSDIFLVFEGYRNLIMFHMNEALCMIDPENGQVVSVTKLDSNTGVCFSPVLYENLIVLFCLNGYICGVDRVNGKKQWGVPADGVFSSQPFVIDGSIFYFLEDGGMYELDIKSKKLRSQFAVKDEKISTVIYNTSTKKFFAATRSGNFYCLSRNTDVYSFAYRVMHI